jgi:hypothetical protein
MPGRHLVDFYICAIRIGVKGNGSSKTQTKRPGASSEALEMKDTSAGHTEDFSASPADARAQLSIHPVEPKLFIHTIQRNRIRRTHHQGGR